MQSCPTDQLYSFLLGNVLISNVQASHLMSYLFLHHLLVMYSSKHLLSYFKNYLAIINFTILSFANCWHLIYNKVLIFKIFTTVLAALKTLALGTFLLLKSTDGMIKKKRPHKILPSRWLFAFYNDKQQCWCVKSLHVLVHLLSIVFQRKIMIE